MSQYNVSKSTVGGYLQVILRLGALSSQSDGRLVLTSFGAQVLEAEGEAKARLVIERFMRGYLAFPEVLAAYAQAEGALHLNEMVEALQSQFPQWTSPAQFEYRALWLLSLGCLQQVKGRYYEITKLGKAIAEQFPPSAEIEVVPPPGVEKPAPPKPVSMADEVSLLITELEKAATDSQTPQRLERAVAEALGFLGFSVDQMGEAGETDVLVRAIIGPESYSVVVDAKTRRDGKLQDLEVYTLQEHQQNSEADYAVVVAGSFAGGKIVRHAKENGVVLLSVPILGAWLTLHAHTPLNLNEYRVMFTTPGLLEDLPTAMKSAAEKRERWGHLLVDLVELIRETYDHGLDQLLPSDQLFTMLVTRLRGVRYSRDEVRRAVTLLTHPAIGAALGEDEKGISLAMNRRTLALVLRALADQIETVEAETQE